MRILFVSVGVGAAAVAAAASWVAAQPVVSTRLVPGSQVTFRRAAQVQLQPTQAARADLTRAKMRPSALALRRSLAETGATRVNLAAVDRTALPVLVSARPALASNLRVFARESSFSASATEPGMTLVIDGSKIATAAPATFRLPRTMTLRPQAMLVAPAVRSDAAAARPTTSAARARLADGTMVRDHRAATPSPRSAPPPPAEAPTLRDVVIERAEYGVDVSFVRFGAVYNVSIACDEPESDPRCSDEGVKAIVSQLETIGGGEAPQ